MLTEHLKLTENKHKMRKNKQPNKLFHTGKTPLVICRLTFFALNFIGKNQLKMKMIKLQNVSCVLEYIFRAF